MSAEPTSANLSRADAISSQLPTRRLNQIDLCSSSQMELNSDLGTNFKAARTDARSNSHDQVLGFATELVCHRFHSLGCDFTDYATPPGMDSRHGAIPRVGDEDRKTVGGPDGEANAGQVRHQRVALAL